MFSSLQLEILVVYPLSLFTTTLQKSLQSLDAIHVRHTNIWISTENMEGVSATLNDVKGCPMFDGSYFSK